MARETELEKKIEGLLENAIAEGELPCANVLVLHKDKTVCYAQAGKDPGTGREIARDTIFRLYSQSKPITSAAVCLLMERGIIDMNDPVEKYLPGFANPKVLGKDGELIPAARSVKLMDLMGMCAGLCYPMEDAPGQYAAELFEKNQAAMDAGGGYTTVEMANEIGKLPLAFQPGTDYRYSTCADVLGAVVETASGKRFGRFLQEEFFEPLEMEDTGFYVPEEKADRLVTCAKRTPEGIQVMECKHLNVGNYTREPAFESGGAGLVSTLDDYRHFASMLLHEGEYKDRRILSRAGGLQLRQADAGLREPGRGPRTGLPRRIRLGRMAGHLLCQFPASEDDAAAESECGGYGHGTGDPEDPERGAGLDDLSKRIPAGEAAENRLSLSRQNIGPEIREGRTVCSTEKARAEGNGPPWASDACGFRETGTASIQMRRRRSSSARRSWASIILTQRTSTPEARNASEPFWRRTGSGRR